ncbi:MAG: protoporphyrinogen oxidase HemJ [Gammaproteobacteria bacterium]|nr:protoporphyrinogen oxidase HemJ [Gammaproteobacteria bacterium]
MGLEYSLLKAFHLIFMVTWFAGLFYLPRLFVYHALAEDDIGIERFKVMERKLYLGILLPASVLTIAAGIGLAVMHGMDWIRSTRWFHLKLALLVLLVAYHFYLGHLRRRFERDENLHSAVFYRWLNELPVLILIAMILLAVLKPS